MDRFVLLAAIILGAVGIIVIKLQIFPINPESLYLVAFIAATWAAIILFLYAFIVRMTSRSQIEPETIGDNCYYLGFLFTLVSLAVTLFELGSSSAQSEILRQIISGFGIALSSTGFGIILRVWYFQQRTDIVARDRENQIEIQRTVREFRNALSESAIRLKQFTTESVQLAVERDEKLRKSMDSIAEQPLNIAEDFSRAMENIHKTVFDSAKASLAELQNSVGQLTPEIDRLRQSNLDAISDFQNKATQAFKASEAHAKKIEGIVATSLATGFSSAANDICKEIIGSSDSAFQELQKSIKQLASEMAHTHRQNIDALSEYGEKARHVLLQLDTISRQTVENVNASQEQYKSVMPEFKKNTDYIRSQFATLSEQIVDTASEYEKLQGLSAVFIQQKLESVELPISNLKANLNNLRQASEALDKRFSQASDSIDDAVRNASTSILKLDRSMQQIAMTLEEAINQINQTASPDEKRKFAEWLRGLAGFNKS